MDSLSLQHLPGRRPHLRVAVVTETYPPEINGVAMTLGRMVTALQARDHDIQLIRPRQGPEDAPSDKPGLSHHLQRGIPIPRYEGLKIGLPAKAALCRLWTLDRPDIVHVATEGPLGWSALAAAGKLKIPLATDFHTNFHSYSRHYGLGFLRRSILAYLRKFHNKARLTFVPTEGIRRELESHGYQNLAVVSRGVDTDLFNPGRRSSALRRQWSVREEEKVLLYVGRLAAEKNLPAVFRTYDAVKAAGHAVRLVLVGDGPEHAGWQSKRPDAVFCGARRGKELAEHYASADVFLFPSLTETFGNVTLEAMASGLAVVAYDYGAAEWIKHGNNGLKAPIGDEDALMREVLAAFAMDDPRRTLGSNAFATAEGLSWQGIYDRFEQALVRLVEESRHGLAQNLAVTT